MFSENYTADNELIVPSDELIHSLATRMKNYDPSKEKLCFLIHKRMFKMQSFKKHNTIFASFLVLILSLSTFAFISDQGYGLKDHENTSNTENSQLESQVIMNSSADLDSDKSMESYVQNDSIISNEGSSAASMDDSKTSEDINDSVYNFKESESSITESESSITKPKKEPNTDATSKYLTNVNLLEKLDAKDISYVSMSIYAQSTQKTVENSTDISLIVDKLRLVELSEESTLSNEYIDQSIVYMIYLKDNSALSFFILGSSINVNGTWYNANAEILKSLMNYYNEFN